MATRYVLNGNDSGSNSLRAVLALSSDGDTIVILPAITTITLQTGIEINIGVTIVGHGSSTCRIIREPGYFPNDPCFYVSAGVVVISGLTIYQFITTGGSNEGGGIRNEATLTLTDVIISECSSDLGGGLYNTSTVTISDSEFVNNYALNGGGGLFNEGGTVSLTDTDFNANTCDLNGGAGILDSNNGTVTCTRCNFDGNSAVGLGGAIYAPVGITLTCVDCGFYRNHATTSGTTLYLPNNPTVSLTRCTVAYTVAHHAMVVRLGTTTIESCTFSKNDGGAAIAILQFGALDIQHSTVVANSQGIATDGSGCVITCQNTIVAGNSSSDLNLLPAEFTSNGYNIFGTNDSGITLAAGDTTGVAATSLLISALADNGPYTLTMALAFNSPAVNKGTNAGAPATDQRGQPRINSDLIDIGAYEFQASTNESGAGVVAGSVACYMCYGVSRPSGMALTLLSNLLKVYDPMADTSPQTLLNDGRCYQCFGPLSASDTMMLSLLSKLVDATAAAGSGGLTGVGDPEGVVTASPGATYLNTTDDSFWVKETGTGNTGWIELIA